MSRNVAPVKHRLICFCFITLVTLLNIINVTFVASVFMSTVKRGSDSSMREGLREVSGRVSTVLRGRARLRGQLASGGWCPRGVYYS